MVFVEGGDIGEVKGLKGGGFHWEGGLVGT
jgi:hypothetical protein